MKTTSIIAFILLLALAMSGDATGASAPYEIVLEGETVVFDKAETVTSQIVIRDLGVKKMIAPDLYWGLSVVWDGKEYKRDPYAPVSGQTAPTMFSVQKLEGAAQ